MRKYNTTVGIWQLSIETQGGIYISDEKEKAAIGKLFSGNDLVETKDEAKSNALLIADAGNTIQLCDKLPSKLWEENQELLEFVKSIGSNYVTLHEKANELINKIQNG